MKSYSEWQGEQLPTARWKANKEQIMSFWQSLQPNTPVIMRPVPLSHKGSTYQQDGIRITGSKEFIDSTLARLKELLRFENPTTKLQVVFRQTGSQKVTSENERDTYVFYIQIKNRSAPKFKKPKIPTLPMPKFKVPSAM